VDSQFELPAGFTEPKPAESNTRLRKVADGVYLDTQIGGVMVVEFDGFLVVVECPDDFQTADSTIVALREKFPSKPVRYVVPSHTHGDHGGGARAYFHVGATLLTTPGHLEFFSRLSRVQQTISPDPYSSSLVSPSIETFSGKRIITDGTQSIVLYDVGPNAHSEELTIVHLPKQRVVWQADVFFTPGTGGGMNAAMPIGVAFAEKLRSLGIADFDLLLESHHSRVITIKEFRSALALSGYHGY
jgi:glyoxylase-like metal-dependent hydrolase (beta-lactamase superfamily II)